MWFSYAKKGSDVLDIYEKFKQEIIQTIKITVQKEIQKLKSSVPRDVPSVVTGISGNKYKVNIDGGEYWIKDGIGLGLTVGMSVWVHVPNGKYTQAFIMAKR